MDTNQKSLWIAFGTTVVTTIGVSVTVFALLWTVSDDILDELKAEHLRIADKIQQVEDKIQKGDDRILDKIDSIADKSQAGDDRLANRIDSILLSKSSPKE